QCFLFNDIVRSLRLNHADKSDAGQRERGRLAFAWAMRQVWLLDQPAPPMPPEQIVRLGFGPVAFRSVAALAVLQQAGVDAGLVAPPGDGRVLRSWAVGVLAGKEVCLFDPRTGEPIPGPGGQGIATLSQVRADPQLVKSAVSATDSSADLKAMVAGSQVWLCPPLSSLAPRMSWLQSVLTQHPPLVLPADLHP